MDLQTPVLGGRGERECLRVVSVNGNAITEMTKRRAVIEYFKNGRVDVLGVTGTHMKGWMIVTLVGRVSCWKGWREV